MRPVAIAIAAFTVLASTTALRPALADQLFAQGGTAPEVGGNGQSGSPAIGEPPARPMHHRRYHARRHMTHMATPASSMPATPATPAMPPADAPASK